MQAFCAFSFQEPRFFLFGTVVHYFRLEKSIFIFKQALAAMPTNQLFIPSVECTMCRHVFLCTCRILPEPLENGSGRMSEQRQEKMSTVPVKWKQDYNHLFNLIVKMAQRGK
jgi:hypothetical protein